VTICQQKPEVISIIEKTLTLLGYHWNPEAKVRSTNFVISNKQLWSYLRPFSLGSLNKKLPAWVFTLSARQSNVLLDALVLGDGHLHKKKHTRHYYTSSIKLAQDVHSLILHSGMSASIINTNQTGREGRAIAGRLITNPYNPSYAVNFLTRNSPYANSSTRPKEKSGWIENYKGKVYCLTVNNSVFYVMPSGCSVWTGDSS